MTWSISALGLGDDLLDARRDGCARPGPASSSASARDLAAHRVEAAQDDRLGRVVDDQVDAGRLLERADVAALAADDAALHLVARQVDDADRVLGGVVGGDALHRGQDDVAGLVLGLLARRRSMARAILTASCSASARTASSSMPLASSALMPGHPLQGVDLLLGGPGEVLLRLVELALAVDELAIALLEHLGALVELLVAVGQPSLLGGQLVAPGPRLVLGLAPEAELLVLGLEDEFLLAGCGPRPRCGGPRPGRPSCPGMPTSTWPTTPSSAPPAAATTATATTIGVSIGFLPSGPDHAAGRVMCAKARSRERGESRRRAKAVPRRGSSRRSGPLDGRIQPVTRSERLVVDAWNVAE